MADIKSIEWEVTHLVKARLFPDEQSVLRTAMRALFEAKPDLLPYHFYTNNTQSQGVRPYRGTACKYADCFAVSPRRRCHHIGFTLLHVYVVEYIHIRESV